MIETKGFAVVSTLAVCNLLHKNGGKMGSSFPWGLVLRGHLDVVDDEGVDGAFGGLELEAELVLDGGKDGNDIGATLLGGDIVGPFEGDVGVAGEAGLVVDLAMDLIGEGGGQVGHGGAFAGEDEACVLAVDVPVAVLEFVLR